MTKTINLTTPLTREKVKTLKAGDCVLITGEVYTSRDAGHKRMIETLERGEKLPIDIMDKIIYYVGPCPAKPGEVIGSAGPTTSGRMDAYTPRLIQEGLTGMVGKGYRSADVINAMKEHKAVYMVAIGGAAALISKTIKHSEVIAYDDLGAEALRKLIVEDFPAIVAIDCEGNNFYEEGQKQYGALNF